MPANCSLGSRTSSTTLHGACPSAVWVTELGSHSKGTCVPISLLSVEAASSANVRDESPLQVRLVPSGSASQSWNSVSGTHGAAPGIAVQLPLADNLL